MKNNIEKLFSKKKNKILSIYFTAGFPELNDTVLIIDELQKSGADMIEIGIPFSDPLADGPIIQHSSETALKNGMNLSLLFQQLEDYHCKFPAGGSGLPLLLIGYLNPILQFGIEKFCKKCYESGISGTIIPDLPLEEYQSHYKTIFNTYHLKNIFFITPQTSRERIRTIDKISGGFIYAVSSSSTTGKKLNFKNEILEYFKRIKSMKLKNPVIIGFGISDKKSFLTACNFANGAIVGSAFVKSMESGRNMKKGINDFMENILS